MLNLHLIAVHWNSQRSKEKVREAIIRLIKHNNPIIEIANKLGVTKATV